MAVAGIHTVLPHPTDPARVVLVAMSTGGVYRTADARRVLGAGQPRHPRRLPARRGTGVRAVRPQGRAEPRAARPIVRAESRRRLSQRRRRRPLGLDRGGPAGRLRLRDGGRPQPARLRVRVPPRRRWGTVPSGSQMSGVPHRRRRSEPGRPEQRPPPEPHYGAVLRDGMCADDADPAGVYFGNRNGEVWASADRGESWQQIATHLPPVLCVRAAVLAVRPWRSRSACPRSCASSLTASPSEGRAGRRGDGRRPAGPVAAERPALERRIRDERGRLRQHVNVFVGDETPATPAGWTCRSRPASRSR